MALWPMMLAALLWVYSMWSFLVAVPRAAQEALFGSQLVSVSDLRSARNECCLLPQGDGYMEWSYDVSAGLAQRLRSGCAARGRGALTDVPGGCVVGETEFGAGGIDGGYRALLVEDRLRLSASWL